MTQDDQKFEQDRETLVAYLDGELSDVEAIEVEKRLSNDVAFRRQLQELEQAWEMLDALPEIEPTESFTRSTMEMVISNETREARRRSRKFWTLPIQVFVLTAIPAICFFGTYQYLKWRNEAPIRELVASYPLLRNYELYESVGSLDFAVKLEQEGLFQQFDEENSDSFQFTPVWTATKEDIVDLDSEERGVLRRQKDRFEQLSTAEKATFQKFHDSVLGREDRSELLKTMKQYNQWLQAVGQTRMVSVQTASADQRIEKIRSVQREMQQSIYMELGKEDKEIVFQWFEKLVVEKENEIRNRIDEATKAKKAWTRMINSRWKPEVMIRVMMRFEPNSVVELVSEESFQNLLNQLSSRGRMIIAEKPSESEQRRFVLMMNLQPYVSEEALRHFYANELTPQQRDELDNMASSEQLRELRKLYFQNKYRSMFPRGSNSNNR